LNFSIALSSAGNDVGFIFAGYFVDVIAVGRKIEENDFVPCIDRVARCIGTDQSSSSNENVHDCSSCSVETLH
jgi:hypothetical protein